MYLNFYYTLSNFVSVLQEEQGTFLTSHILQLQLPNNLEEWILINIVSISVLRFSAFLASFQIFDVPVKLFNAIKPPVQF
jgi:hypothetical protein